MGFSNMIPVTPGQDPYEAPAEAVEAMAGNDLSW